MLVISGGDGFAAHFVYRTQGGAAKLIYVCRRRLLIYAISSANFK